MRKASLLIFFLFVLILNTTYSQSEIKKEEENQVEKAVIEWADSTFKEYNEPRFEKYRANYTDEYLMASMRIKGIDDRIHELRKEYTSGKYKGSEQAFTETIEDLKSRKEEASEDIKDFHPKVTNYVINFWANILLDSGVLNYVNHKVILDDQMNVVKTKIIGNIGDNENAKIVYR
ncbi:MAG: hypothetical protein WEA99_01665 [Brumimicrobium sp.]